MSVSVVISTYNRCELLLRRSLDSVLRQTVPATEIIVVGDGTDAETVTQMEALAACHCHRIKFWNLPHQQYPQDESQRWCVAGLEARNFGLSQVTSEWVCTLDDDDEYTDDHIEVLLRAVTSGDYDFAYGMSDSHWPDNHNQTYGQLPLQHFNACVPANTMIEASDATAGYRRHYEGPMVHIATRIGRKVACTPNHPVATRRGWVPAQEVQVGDYVFCRPDGERVVKSGPDVDDVPSTAEDRFHALEKLGLAERISQWGLDFHGDNPLYEKVDVVTSNGSLLADENASLPEPRSHLLLADANSSLSSLPRGRYFRQMSLAQSNSGSSFVGSLQVPSDVSRPESSHSNLSSVARTSHRYAEFAKSRANYGTGNPESFSHLVEGFPTEIDRSQIVGSLPLVMDVVSASHVAPFGGDVYNFSTTRGWYVADNIVLHNCDGSWILRANLGYRYDPGCIERGLPEDGDLLDRIVADGRKWIFVPRIIHQYYPSPRNWS